MKQFHCDKLHCLRSDIVQTVVKYVSVKYSLLQMNVSNKYKIVQTHFLKGVEADVKNEKNVAKGSVKLLKLITI